MALASQKEHDGRGTACMRAAEWEGRARNKAGSGCRAMKGWSQGQKLRSEARPSLARIILFMAVLQKQVYSKLFDLPST
eukprot:1098910-Pelagomonas_calceolata.AAC.1